MQLNGLSSSWVGLLLNKKAKRSLGYKSDIWTKTTWLKSRKVIHILQLSSFVCNFLPVLWSESFYCLLLWSKLAFSVSNKAVLFLHVLTFSFAFPVAVCQCIALQRQWLLRNFHNVGWNYGNMQWNFSLILIPFTLSGHRPQLKDPNACSTVCLFLSV